MNEPESENEDAAPVSLNLSEEDVRAFNAQWVAAVNTGAVALEAREVALRTQQLAVMKRRIEDRGGVTRFQHSANVNLAVVEFSREMSEAETGDGNADEDADAVVVFVRLVAFVAEGFGHEVGIDKDGRVERRDFTWQKQRRPDVKFCADEGARRTLNQPNFFFPANTIGRIDEVMRKSVIVHPHIGVSEARLDASSTRGGNRLPAKVPLEVLRLMKMWELAVCGGAGTTASTFDRCSLCHRTGSRSDLFVFVHPLCLLPVHSACADAYLTVSAAAPELGEPTKPSRLFSLPGRFGEDALCPLRRAWVRTWEPSAPTEEQDDSLEKDALSFTDCDPSSDDSDESSSSETDEERG